MLGKLLFKLNDKLTRKKFTHVSDDGEFYYTVAKPEDFFTAANQYGYDVFSMACLQSYVQMDNGRWYPGIVFPFENHTKMKEAGILPTKEVLRDSSSLQNRS